MIIIETMLAKNINTVYMVDEDAKDQIITLA